MKKVLTTADFIIKASKIHINKYDYSESIYTETHKKVNIICPLHGIFNQTPHHHLQGEGCPKCGNELISKLQFSNIDEFISKSNIVHAGLYLYDKVDYKGSPVKVIITCKIHGDFNQVPNSHLKGRGCPHCGLITMAKSQSNTLEEFILNAKKIHGDKYKYNEVNYSRGKTKINIICLQHGIFNQIPNSHLNGNGCPKCKLSKGENLIQVWLQSRNIQYVTQKSFEDCKNPKTNYKLRFDFYIPSKNVLIEFDGKQHFAPIKIMGKYQITNDDFEKIQYRDKIKTEYAQNARIPLIRIPYNQIKSIPTILENSIK